MSTKLPIRAAARSSGAMTDQKLTLQTLPTEIKDEIFSNLLLAEKVKYLKEGHEQRFRYRFDTAIMGTCKQLYNDANTYFRSHNEFALIHVKHPGLLNEFAPRVTTGKATKTFEDPAVEVLIENLDPSAVLPEHILLLSHEIDLEPEEPERLLLLTHDLDYFCRQIQLSIHTLPLKPIFVRGTLETGFDYLPRSTNTRRRIFYKVNPSRRPDPTSEERRARQERLIAPMTAVSGLDGGVSFSGIDPDVAARAVRVMTGRIFAVDAVGWNLLEHMQNQKCFLDGISTRSPQTKGLSHAYMRMAILLDDRVDLEEILFRNTPLDIASIVDAIYTRGPKLPSGADQLQEPPRTEAWFYGALRISLECILNALSLELHHGDYESLEAALPFLIRVLHMFDCLLGQMFPDYPGVLVKQFLVWGNTLATGNQPLRTAERVSIIIRVFEGLFAEFYLGDEFIMEDLEQLRQIQSDPSAPVGLLAPGLRRRARLYTQPLSLSRPKDLHGWTSDEVDGFDDNFKKEIIKKCFDEEM